jgi:hypothetical protein
MKAEESAETHDSQIWTLRTKVPGAADPSASYEYTMTVQHGHITKVDKQYVAPWPF